MQKIGMHNQNDAMLAAAAAAGNKAALETLLRRNWPWLKGIVLATVCRGDWLDDIMQDICLKVIDNIASLKEPERFGPWLAVIARNEAVNMLRQQAKQTQLSQSLHEDAAADAAHEPPRQLWPQETGESLWAALKRLPEKYREVFVLKYIHDYSYAQIAEAMDIPFTTVQIRLTRARRMLLEIVRNRQLNTENKE